MQYFNFTCYIPEDTLALDDKNTTNKIVPEMSLLCLSTLGRALVYS
jgi:hypothetical protein